MRDYEVLSNWIITIEYNFHLLRVRGYLFSKLRSSPLRVTTRVRKSPDSSSIILLSFLDKPDIPALEKGIACLLDEEIVVMHGPALSVECSICQMGRFTP